MRKILHVIESMCDFGGTPRKLSYLVKYNDNGRFHHTFLIYRPSDLRNVLESYGADVIELRSTNMAKLIFTIARVIKERDIDIVSTHYTRPLIVGGVASVILGVPFIHNEHSSINYRTGTGATLSRFVLPYAKSIISNSFYTQKSVKGFYNIGSEKYKVIYNPVVPRNTIADRCSFRQRFNISESSLLMAHVGGMIPQRDQATLIKACHKIIDEGKDIFLFIAGDGIERKRLEQLASELRIADKIHLAGYIDEIGDLLNAADVYINTTLDEGFGIAVVEAMQAKLPVVLSNNGAHPELISDGVEGLLFEGGEASDLYSKLIALIDDRSLLMGLGESAYIKSQEFSPNLYTSEYLREIDCVVDSVEKT